ncbi:hypothetical protein ABENE_13905 [Asticcacaulis benevestitus DSM 16100 = ATCC BAA-896]|uniref:DUF4129 domain-containing protein n=1 Tax=Asticcacaulis benevestitus DSM 16100 = ATCC BAA-896 TaxID=1121022 RepID=V4PQ62_9CAUL|nr:hypothetical protein ABENE_13905 [Asticcacaulis benevestitus DSM 16100 = ATCC BAA-896]
MAKEGGYRILTQTGAKDSALQVSGQVASQAAASATPNAPLDLAQANKLIGQVNSQHDLQTTFTAMPKPDLKALAFWKKVMDSIGHFFEGIAKVFAPLGPFMPYILGALAIALIAVLLSPVVRLMISTRFQRLFQRDHLRADAPWRPTREAVVALLADIDALAVKGDYDEAVHLLLARSVADINAFRPNMVRKHYSARDISSHPLLPEAARPAFVEIVRWVEMSYFAGIPAGKAGFDACRAAYVAFVAAEGIT